jgi:predicted Zn-dependent peptidase
MMTFGIERFGEPNSLLRSISLGVSALLLLLPLSAVFGQKPDRTKPPRLGPSPSLKLPPIQHLKLPNDLNVLLMEKHQVPLVQIELVVLSGSTMEPPEMKGIASITAAMMDEGAGSRNALELADAIDFLGANINAFAEQHYSGVVLHTPLSKLDSALSLFADVALHPTFPPDELDRIRKERLTTLGQWHDEPPQIATVLLGKTLFGPAHPYGRLQSGDEKSLRSISVSDLKKFHSTYFRPNNACLIIVGDVTASSILPKLEQLFKKWDKGNVEQPSIPPVEQVKERIIYLVDKPGAPQSVIRIGRIGAPRLTDDYFPLLVMNTILGGSFTSRLNQNLRETHGYTYGAGSAFEFLPTPGAFEAGADVQTKVTDKSLAEFMKELKGIGQSVSDTELMRAKNYLTLRYPGNFQSVAQVARQLRELVLYRLPDDYFNDYSRRILAVTKEDADRVARKYIDPENIAIVIVGDRKEIEPGVAALKLGPMKYLSIDDVLGPAPSLGPGR